MKLLWILLVALAIVIGLYPGMYFLVDRHFGLLNTKSTELLANPFWNVGFYTHIILGGVSLLVGWSQFSSKIRSRKRWLHKQLGRVYLIAVILSSWSGIYIGFYATGGPISALGFICLGLIWFYTTIRAYLYVRNKEVERHQKLMIYSYAACFAAVTLRIWLPVLQFVFVDFITAYRIVAWLCWVPNLIVARLLTSRLTTPEN